LAATVIADTGFLVALLRRRDRRRDWATAVAREAPRPWHTCEAVLTEAHFILPLHTHSVLAALLERELLVVSFAFQQNRSAVLSLMQKYVDVPADFADACLVRMSEILPDPVVLTTDVHFRVYRRLGRQVIPARMPN
jgi:predicted nucleic acid-binding protein